MITRVRLRAVLFDLDGTLVDTAPDMAGALNRLLQDEGRRPVSPETARPYVSHGSLGLVRFGFGDGLTDTDMQRLIQGFLQRYQESLCVGSKLFDGMETVLESIEAADLDWGIVTNKPGYLTEPLLQALGLMNRADCVVSGDTVALRKPDPLPLTHAARQLGHHPEACLYVGDAERDIQAGRASGMRTLIARYGYIGEHDEPESWLADGELAQPHELLNWLQLTGTDDESGPDAAHAR